MSGTPKRGRSYARDVDVRTAITLSIPEVAKALRRSEDSVRFAAATGQIPTVKAGERGPTRISAVWLRAQLGLPEPRVLRIGQPPLAGPVNEPAVGQ
jgi:hypothetical protein